MHFLNEIQALIPLAFKFCSLQIVRNLTVHSNLMGDLLKVRFDEHLEIFLI